MPAGTSALKKPSPLWKEVDDMTDKDQQDSLLDTYVNLQRIITAADPTKEAEYQLKIVKAKLEARGIPTEDLDIH